MIYKVHYYTLAILSNGDRGNVKQSSGFAYCAEKLDNLQQALDQFLLKKMRVGVIERIELMEGDIVPKFKEEIF